MDYQKKGFISIIAIFIFLFLITVIIAGSQVFNKEILFRLSASNINISKNKVYCDNLAVSSESGKKPLEIEALINAHSIGNEKIISYEFDFGDKNITTIQNNNSITYTYRSSGTYTLKGYVNGQYTGKIGGINDCQKSIKVE